MRLWNERTWEYDRNIQMRVICTYTILFFWATLTAAVHRSWISAEAFATRPLMTPRYSLRRSHPSRGAGGVAQRVPNSQLWVAASALFSACTLAPLSPCPNLQIEWSCPSQTSSTITSWYTHTVLPPSNVHVIIPTSIYSPMRFVTFSFHSSMKPSPSNSVATATLRSPCVDVSLFFLM